MVLNEYALVVGIITLNDVMNTLMGDLVSSHSLEEQIVKRDEHSWLIDGAAPIDDVMRALLELMSSPRRKAKRWWLHDVYLAENPETDRFGQLCRL